MNWTWIVLVVLTASPFIVDSAYGQSAINVTEFQPCFLNYSAQGIEMLQQCNFENDYLDTVTVGFDYVTGGLLPVVIVSVIIVGTYLKYQTGIYPLAIGVAFLPFAAFLFPEDFINYSIIISAVIGAGAVVNAIIKQTKDY